ncbi:MAG TPA: hypothetical protein VJX67_24330 [Blastocatellia bacterium]|nr:hypothetical protein [Blastocatellia bacterium]
MKPRLLIPEVPANRPEVLDKRRKFGAGQLTGELLNPFEFEIKQTARPWKIAGAADSAGI